MSTLTAERTNSISQDGGDHEEQSSRNRAIPFSDAIHALYNTQTFIIGYLGEAARSYVYSSRRGVISFSKSIPRRPEKSAGKDFGGNYMELAYQTLVEARAALPHAIQGNSIPLLGRGIESRYRHHRITKRLRISVFLLNQPIHCIGF